MFQEDKQHKLFPIQWAISQTHHSTNKPPQLLPVSPSAGNNPEPEAREAAARMISLDGI